MFGRERVSFEIIWERKSKLSELEYTEKELQVDQWLLYWVYWEIILSIRRKRCKFIIILSIQRKRSKFIIILSIQKKRSKFIIILIIQRKRSKLTIILSIQRKRCKFIIILSIQRKRCKFIIILRERASKLTDTEYTEKE